MLRTHLDTLVDQWQTDPDFAINFTFWDTRPAKPARFVEWPEDISPQVRRALENDGIHHLFSHQGEALQQVATGKDVVVVTGTASGKTLCYNLPVLQSLTTDTEATAIYLFPTKALTHDQETDLKQLVHQIPGGPAVSVYDGDTPANQRPAIREKARILLTNPDMLHTGVLPHHTRWMKFLSHLRFVVIDEMHTYRGVFGSHICNLLRRLKRLAAFYGSFPQFILTSATIGNPMELASNLIEKPVTLIDEDGSWKGKKHFAIYNPPLLDVDLGIRKSAFNECLVLGEQLLERRIQTVVFARSRRTVEQFTREIRLRNNEHNQVIRGYRSGYLPSERRKIEADLRSGTAELVAATNALELGIDIGGLSAVLMMGYPGSIAATRQQAGRAGRKEDTALSILVASANPIDQYLARNPDYLTGKSPEQGLIDPDNILILLSHLRCAAFELPFKTGEKFGHLDPDLLSGLLQVLLENRFLVERDQQFFWIADEYPAASISLRSASADVIALQAVEGNQPRLIGEIDLASALWMVHPGAVYLHEGETFAVQQLDLENKTARLIPQATDYYTEPIIGTEFSLISKHDQQLYPSHDCIFGEILVTSQVSGYRRMMWGSRQTLEENPLDLPATQLRTTGCWWVILPETVTKLDAANQWRNSPNDYGSTWKNISQLVRARDQYACQVCGAKEMGKAHHVHHKIPFRMFLNPQEANRLENLVTLCPACHQRAELMVKVRSSMAGLTYSLQQIAPLFVMCDPMDLGASCDQQSSLAENQPAIVLYDQVPAGIGLSRRIFDQSDKIIAAAQDLIVDCPCSDGCPSCVGPAGENGLGAKQETISLARILLEKS